MHYRGITPTHPHTTQHPPTHTHHPLPTHTPSTHTDLVRIRTALFLEQEEIRADVGRVGNELEMLDQTIRVHIARNTACLDTGILSKKKRRRRSFK